MKLGGTGTEQGMSNRQRTDFILFITSNEFDEFHHGDCVGADAQMHDIIMKLFPAMKIIIHPPSSEDKRAFCHTAIENRHSPKPYLERNRDIAEACDILIATPLGNEILRSGTWATVRYARKLGKRVEVLYR